MPTNPDGPPAVEDIATLGDRVSLTRTGRALLPASATPTAFLAKLLQERMDIDAIPVLACVLPVRRAVWWGTVCAWHALSGRLPPHQDGALGSAVRWVVQPRHEQAKACAAAAVAATLAGPAGCCAKAAALAGTQAHAGSFAPNQPILAAKLVASAVVFAFARTRERDPGITYRHFLELGREVADGKLAWEPLPV